MAMNVLYLTFSSNIELSSGGVHIDLVKKFIQEGHHVYVICPLERRNKQPTHLEDDGRLTVLRTKTLNLKRTNSIEKGIGTILVETQFKKAIKKYLHDVKFDLMLYSTPPITFGKVIRYMKNTNPGVISYLVLKDIFPQNAVDLGMFSQKSIIYRWFRKKEIELYKCSDYIGCMSPANAEYVKRHNPFYPPNRVEIAPNSIELYTDNNENRIEDINHKKKSILAKYLIPNDRIVFIYGGNLGRPQGIHFLIRCLEMNKNRNDCHFVVVGDGAEFPQIERWYNEYHGKNVTLLRLLPKKDYDLLVRSCDVGLIFLDHRFTIPNYPARLLSYLEHKMPVICATDPNTDVGRIAEENGYGFWCESLREVDFSMLVNRFVEHPEIIPVMGERGYRYLCENYTVQNTYDAIMGHFSGSRRVDE